MSNAAGCVVCGAVLELSVDILRDCHLVVSSSMSGCEYFLFSKSQSLESP